VALEATFEDLVAHLHRVGDVLNGARLTVQEDRPADDGAPIDRLADAVDDAIGWLEEAKAAAFDAQQAAAAHPFDGQRASRALASCQERFLRMSEHFAAELVSHERLADVRRFSRTRGGEWRAWAAEATAAIDRCRDPLDAAARALFQCWRDLTERLGASGISVQTTTVGQNIQQRSLA
jgi:hypothetical protein